MKSRIINSLPVLLLSCLLATCQSPNPKEVTGNQDDLPAKAPQEQAEKLDARQTEWSQSTYAEEPPREIPDTSQLKQDSLQ